LFLFLRLLLAHLVADFPLQFTKLFKLKSESFKGVVLHGCIFGIIAVLFSYPFITFSFIGMYLLFLWVFHIFIDWLKIHMIHKWKREDNLGLFILDQVLHLISIAVVIPFTKIQVRTAAGLGKLYMNDKFIVFCIFYIISMFMATILIYYMKKTFTGKEVYFPRKGKYRDIFERAIVTTLVVLPGWYWALIPVVVGTKVALCAKHNFKENEYDYSIFTLIASPSIAVISGLILRIFFM